MNDPIVYADGYGRWHAYIPKSVGTGAIPVLYASQLISAELAERGSREDTVSAFAKYVSENISLAEDQDKPGYIHFVEYQLDKDVA